MGGKGSGEHMSDEPVKAGKDIPDALEATRVTADEVLARVKRGEPIVFVDARREDEWRKASEKLPRAVRLSPRHMTLDETLPIVPTGRAVVTYCTCEDEASSARVARVLASRGYTDVHTLYGGFEAWRRAGGPLEPK
jgi:rhodanese-related sulfurtransferase